jgi:hypothetical protein
MKTSFLFLFIISSALSESDVNFVASALSHTVKSFFTRQLDSFDFIVDGRNPQKLFDIVNEVSKRTKTASRILHAV